MRIGIDLLWVRPGIVGGTESFIRNLMDGFGQYDKENEYVLFVARDNADTFKKYEEYTHMRMQVCPIDCARQWKRILWENLYLDRVAKKAGVDVMFIPVYSKPVTYGSGIPYVCVIHDVQALHYPEYFSKGKRLFLRYMWWYACKSSDKVITISEFCGEDLRKRYPFVKEKLQVVYIPVVTQNSKMEFEILEKKYSIKKELYYYCVSSLMPHKNLDTVLKAIADLKKQGNNIPLVISGVGGEKTLFAKNVKMLGIEDLVIDTGFVSNEERDCLYENCKLFLFPSIFEGFGMPPIEAMRRGKRVIATKLSCVKEVTRGKAIYVNEPFDAKEWVERISEATQLGEEKYPFEQYELENIAKEYIVVWKRFK